MYPPAEEGSKLGGTEEITRFSENGARPRVASCGTRPGPFTLHLPKIDSFQGHLALSSPIFYWIT